MFALIMPLTCLIVTTCAPLHTRGRVQIINGTTGVEGMTGDTIFHYDFGSVTGTQSYTSNYTLAYNNHSYLDNIGYGVK